MSYRDDAWVGLNYDSNVMCISKKTGKPKKNYDTESQAMIASEKTKEMHGLHLTPYQCNNCCYWHLAPADRHTPSTDCPNCVGARNNRPKKLYPNKEVAMRRSEIIYSEQGVRLRAYPCPFYNGYHLTKSN